MKSLQTVITMIAVITLLASCQSAKQDLSNLDSRKEIMTVIANDRTMSNEMMTALMNGPNRKMIMQENQNLKMMMTDEDMMTDLMNNNPEMMQHMLSNIIEYAKGDTSMMAAIHNTMMGDQQMMDMMQMQNGKSMNMKNRNGM